MKNNRAFTLVEMMMVVAIMGMVALMVAGTQKAIFSSVTESQAWMDMQTDASRLLAKLKVDIETGGGGMRNIEEPDNKTLFARLELNLPKYLIFFQKDDGTDPDAIDVNDTWKEYFYDTTNRLLYENTYKTDAWDNIINLDGTRPSPALAPLTQTPFHMSPGIYISDISFTYYKSDQHKTASGYAASWVRINIEIKHKSITKLVLNKHIFVLMKSLLYQGT